MYVFQRIKKAFLFLCLLAASLMANIAVHRMPFKKLMEKLTNAPETVDGVLTDQQAYRLYLVRIYLEKIDRMVPWRVMCFEQAVVVLAVCRLMKINMNIYFGVRRDDDNQLKAHAWTRVGKWLFSGGGIASGYSVVYERGLMF